MIPLRWNGSSLSVLGLLVATLVASGCASGASTSPSLGAGAGPSSPGASVEPSSPLEDTVVQQAWKCPDGPFPPPLEGTLEAEAIPDTEPMALDPADTGFHLFEGPVWKDGALYFSDFQTTAGFPSRILRYTAARGLEIAIPNSGSNGLALDPTGTKLAGARHAPKSVAFISGDGSTADIATGYDGRGFNSPNDLVFRADGQVYFTDPDFQSGGEKPQSTTNVYRVAPNGTVSVVDDSIQNPNGVALSLDGSVLYVAGNLEQGFLKRYPVAADGSVGEGEVLLDGIVVPDGLAIDCAGNIYVTEHTEQRIRVVSPEGRELGRIVGMDKNVTNAAFGGDDRKTLFITGTGRLFKIKLPVPGLPY